MQQHLPSWVSLAGCRTPADKIARIEAALSQRGYVVVHHDRTKVAWGRGRARHRMVQCESVQAVQPDGRHVTFTF